MPFRAFYLDPDGVLHRNLTRDQVINTFHLRQGLLWMDISETTEQDAALMEKKLGFHHLAVEDALSPQVHAPKIDDYGSYLFLVVHGINYAVPSDIVETTELSIFLGATFVVSNHNFPVYSVDNVLRLVEEDSRLMRRGADFLSHALIDGLIDNVLNAVDQMSDAAEQLEEESIRAPSQDTLEAILRLKRSVIRMHRIMIPQREVLNRLSRGEFSLIKTEAEIFYRDIYDHLVGIENLILDTREAADSALSSYLSSMSNRQNETLKLLSIVATIFLPLSLLAGIYGMNFDYLPGREWPWGFFVIVGFMAAVIGGVLSWFWVKRWITWGRGRVRRTGLLAVGPGGITGYLRRHLPGQRQDRHQP